MSSVLLAALAVTLAAATARPPTPDETRLFDEGMRAFSAGDARGAERAWQAGYALAHDPAFLVRIGEAEEKAGAPAEAAASYRRYLREAPDASDRPEIELRLARLPPPPAAPKPEGPPEPTGELGGVPHPEPPSGEPGTEAAAPAPSAAPRPTAGAPAPLAPTDEERPPAPSGDDSGWNRYNVTAFAATAATVALLGTAVFFAATAASNQGDVERLIFFRDPSTGAPLPYSSVASKYSAAVAAGRADARDAKLALAGAAGSTAVAAIFFALDARRGAETAMAPSISLATVGSGQAVLGGLSWSY